MEFKKVPAYIAEQVDEMVAVMRKIRVLRGIDKELKIELKDWAKCAYFEDNFLKKHVYLSYDLIGHKHKARMQFVNKYSINAECCEKLQNLLTETFDTFFGQAHTISINIAPGVIPPHEEATFLAELQALCDKYKIDPQIVNKMEAKSNFHVGRLDLPYSTNQQIDEIMPMEIKIIG